MNRRNFLEKIAAGGMLLFIPFESFSINLFQGTFAKDSLQKIIDIINGLKKEGSNIIRKTLNNKKYVRNFSVHYPYDDSVEDVETHCQVFFHAHRKGEYGHFHTFINNEKGELVHLIMISMDKKGNPVALCTLNNWVTGDTFVEAAELKELFCKFNMNHDLFPDERIIEFIENIFIGYNDLIFELFDERDRTIKIFMEENNGVSIDDPDTEILSERKIDVFRDSS